MARALKVCSKPGCPTLVATGRCPTHTRAADRARGTATQRGYNGPGHTQRFRPGVLRKDPLCACDGEPCTVRAKDGTVTPLHPPGQCYTPSTVADHHPLGKRELIDAGMDDDDPQHGRGLCERCHNRHTARAQPGGWNQR